MGRRILNEALRAIVNAERRGKATVELKPISTVMSSFLKIMKDRVENKHRSWLSLMLEMSEGYIKNFQVYDPHRVGRITVELQGRVNDCHALTYRQDIKARDIEGYRLRMLPTHQWGYVVITTPDGLLDHEEAIKRNVGGQVVGYFH
ncbi:40S ribosomal protein S15a-5 [Morella rubra]|uniref:40S ribosomal protein S15a-5 n=1 Tax=Morella rubra TaxID=262757 RepID=A0A6A1VAW6_9ROSI|nr:40S ribosomal protein S15a-5 [Morella rubra]